MKFFPFGDSHSIFWANQENFGDLRSSDSLISQIHWMGPATIWGLGNESANKTKDRFIALLDIFQRQNNIVPIACFGEIDIRVNLSRYILTNRKFDYIENLAKLYLEQINRIPSKYIILWGPGPSMTDLSQTQVNTEWPSFGNEFTRNVIIHKFNQAILANINKYPRIKFASLFYDLVDSNLRAKVGALKDGLHLNNSWYQLALSMIMELMSREDKAIFNYNFFKYLNSIDFSFKENATPEILYFYQLYKFYEPSKFEVFLQAFTNHEGFKISTIELEAKRNDVAEIFELKKEKEFVRQYFSKSSIKNIQEFVTYATQRLNKKNADMYDVITKSTDFNKDFFLNHFEILKNQLNVNDHQVELDILFNQLNACLD
jgi:hypothetical protein